ncbi:MULTISPECIES: tyrosine-type recombinase/integrase [Sphingomonadales]|uniref:Integrase n=2 Tax=Sphingomonadales TaxID=204457 RepID=A0A0G3XN78_9SPHN|nr:MULTISPECIES: tyrosine-type recombinase/integrase [Sphingomonadales]AKM12081.1 integrase [Croceicoccus naphthovorans]EHJ57991.1 phage integrase domain/SAM domain-containing protein [Novosphingobium pentaromativorans US6-1]EZP70132.1 Phage integrase domain/SAM domain-containing protein [Sphingomonas paucimobilis]MBB3991876.1 integrase [Croceicoccus naphthovorans]
MLAATDGPFPSSVELVLRRYAPLVDARGASSVGFEAAVAAMAPATKAAITADLKCFLAWCKSRRPVATAVPAEPETLVHYLRWLAKGSDTRTPAKPATLARRIASIARVHRMLGFGDSEPLPTQAGMVRDTLKGIRRDKRHRQRQAGPLRLGDAMAEGQGAPEGVTVKALLASCSTDIIGLRDAALISLAYDAGLRVSELVGTEVADLRQVGDGSGRLEIGHSKTDQLGEGALAWLSPETMGHISAWLLASGIGEGPVFRRINVLTSPPDPAGQQIVRHYIGAKPLTRQGVVAILRRRVLEAIDLGHVELEPGMEGDTVRALSAHSFRVGLTQDLFAAGEDGAGIALALRWSSQTTALRYARELAVGSNAAARVLGNLRRGSILPKNDCQAIDGDCASG